MNIGLFLTLLGDEIDSFDFDDCQLSETFHFFSVEVDRCELINAG